MSDESEYLIEQDDAAEFMRRVMSNLDGEKDVQIVHLSKIERMAKNVIAAWDQADNLAYDVTYPPLVEAVMCLKAALSDTSQLGNSK
jgi:hypothetical protein